MHIGWEHKLSFLFAGDAWFRSVKAPDLALGSEASSGSTVAQDNPVSRGANPPSPAPGLLPKKKEPDDHKPTPEPNIRRSPE